MKIDHDLRERMREKPESVEEIALCCKASAAIADDDLNCRGFTVLERQSVAGECFVYGQIKLGDIEKLSDLTGIETASSAPEAEISNG